METSCTIIHNITFEYAQIAKHIKRVITNNVKYLVFVFFFLHIFGGHEKRVSWVIF